MVEISDLTLNLGGRALLSNISLTLNDGEVIGLIGRAGSGKSMLLSVLAGEHRDFGGEVLINNRPLRSYSRGELGRTVTLHAEGPANADETVREFLKLARLPFKKLLDPYSEYDHQLIEEYIAALELGTVAGETLRTLSGSYAKRLVLVFSLIRNTDLLLLDDPTAGLDLRSMALLQKAVSRYALSGKNIAVIAANDLNFIAQTADRVIVLDGGRVVLEGGAGVIDADMVKQYFGLEVFVSKNVYNGKPNVHFFPEN